MAEAQLTNQLTRIDSMTNVELRAELKRRGCPTSGNKKDLLAKLRVALQKEYEQTASQNTSTMNTMSFDGRNSNVTGLQQSPVVSYDANRLSLNSSTASSNNYMTPSSTTPVVYAQHMHSNETPITYSNLQVHEQSTGHYAPGYNLSAQQNVHQQQAPMIPVPQQLTLSPADNRQIYDQTHFHSQQQQQFSPMSTRQQRRSFDAPVQQPTIPTVPMVSPERKTRSRSKTSSVDSRPIETQPQIAVIVDPPAEIIQPTAVQQPIVNEIPVQNTSPNVNSGNAVEINMFVSKRNEEQQDYIDKMREERENSRSPSVGSSSAKSESVIKEIPMSGERHRLSRSKSPKSRWHHSPSPHEQTNQSSTNDDEQNSVTVNANDDKKAINTERATSSNVDASAEKETIKTAENEKQQENPSSSQIDETIKKDESASVNDQQSEKATPQQQLKPSRSQTSSSSSLMKGLNRSSASNKVNLSSDVLKTLIPDISLAPESVINDELESSENGKANFDDAANASNQPVLETSVGNGFLINDPALTIEELADHKPQRNRTVVIDVSVDSSSLNDDLLGNNTDNRKKNVTSTAPIRMASFESKTLLDGKTNALMIDEPVRVKDATMALEPPSQILYIRGLTRPFTLTLLKELLGRFGTLVDGEFWLDKIKSQCFVTYNTIEEAQNARESLDGCRWPSSNPKTLSVRFARQDEFKFSRTRDLPPDQMSNESIDTMNNRIVQEKPTTNNKTSTSSTARRSPSPNDELKHASKKVRSNGNNDVREWDLPKIQQEKEKSSTERNVVEESAVKAAEAPAKSLDDYFRKTKAKPAIYWLPLTDEQVIERNKRQEQRNAERAEAERKRQIEENARIANSNNKDCKMRSNDNDNTSSNRSHRRSPSPRDKRRRGPSISPPPKRDNKRH